MCYIHSLRSYLHLRGAAGEPTWWTITLEPSCLVHACRTMLTQTVNTVFCKCFAVRPRVPRVTHTSISICQLFTEESPLRVTRIWHTWVHRWGAFIAMVSCEKRDQSSYWCAELRTVSSTRGRHHGLGLHVKLSLPVCFLCRFTNSIQHVPEGCFFPPPIVTNLLICAHAF